MTLRPFYIVAIAVAVLLFPTCKGGKKNAPSPVKREFPTVKVPAVYTEVEEVEDYVVTHYWDAFFALKGPVDSALILGVSKGDVEQAFSNFLALLDELPLAKAQARMT